MNGLDFYNITERELLKVANTYGINDLEKYYELTDTKSVLNKWSGLELAFAQLSFHAQNSSRISNIIKFKTNLEYIEQMLCGFNIHAFLKKYPADKIKRDESVNKMLEDFRTFLNWNSNKSKERPDSLMIGYSNCLLNSASYLSRFKSRQEVVDDLLSHYEYAGYRDLKQLVEYFRKQIQKGYSIALSCDFLKEFDIAFNDIAKPDIHIIDVMQALYHPNDKEYYKGDAKKYECIKDLQTLVSEANSLNPDLNLTVYKLDRMIWLICSGNFFLDNLELGKAAYIKKLK